MLDFITAYEIVNELENKKHNILWVRFNHTNTYTTIYCDTYIGVGSKVYAVTPIKSYEIIVGFVYDDVVYEIGKHSRTTSRQLMQICNTYYSNYDRIYMEKR